VFIFIATAVFIFGLLFGSFSNVLIYRIPRGESIVFPPSHCPKCGARIKPYDNIPIISYIMLGGRCRSCHQPISIRYPLVELSVGLIFLLNFLLFGFSVNFARFLLFMYSLFLLSLVNNGYRKNNLEKGGNGKRGYICHGYYWSISGNLLYFTHIVLGSALRSRIWNCPDFEKKGE